MHLTKKHLALIAAISLITTFMIRFITILSIQDIYSCTTIDCLAQSQASTNVSIGIALQYVSLAIFAASLLMLIYRWVTKKK